MLWGVQWSLIENDLETDTDEDIIQCLLIIKEIIIFSNIKTMCKEHEPNQIPVTKLERASRNKTKKLRNFCATTFSKAFHCCQKCISTLNVDWRQPNKHRDQWHIFHLLLIVQIQMLFVPWLFFFFNIIRVSQSLVWSAVLPWWSAFVHTWATSTYYL